MTMPYYIKIRKDYAFELIPNKQNDTAIATFKSPHIERVFCVVLRLYSKYGINPFFDMILKEPEIDATNLKYIEDIWHHLFPNIPFKKRNPTHYSFMYYNPQVFRFVIQPDEENC